MAPSQISLNGTNPKVPVPDDAEPLNVIIPIGGIGSRFQKEGFRFPKPLINIVGRPMMCWLIDRLNFGAKDTLWIAINEAVDDEFSLGQLMRKEFPKMDIRVLRLRYLTKGAAETLFIVTQSMPADYRQRRTISVDCDTIYFADILTKVRTLPKGYGACVYFEVPPGTDPIYSYIRTDGSEENFIVELKEKRSISSNANTGAYIFPSGEALRKWAAVVLDKRLLENTKNIGVKDEYYVSHLIAEMISEHPFVGIRITEEDFSCVGTPRQLDEFLLRIKKEPALVTKKRRFCFDLDGTLVGLPTTPGDYSTCQPIWKNIMLVRQLHAAGHHIIIQTARRMRTHNGNVGAVIADIGPVTLKSLADFGIPYDEIFFGKPYAHIYVDDLAVNANLDTRRETGWLREELEALTIENKMADPKEAQKAGIIASRSFNHVQIVGDQIIKSSQSDAILGEMYFYAHMPDQIADLFPTVYSIEYLKDSSQYSLTMERLTGVTYTHLLLGRSLTAGRLKALLLALNRIHKASPESSVDLKTGTEIDDLFAAEFAKGTEATNIYANYSAKVKDRYKKYRSEYDSLSPDTQEIAYAIISRLESYEKEGRGRPTAVIHGDPVFSNALLDESVGKVRFLDVRGQVGSTYTTAGDICYDLAKVFQSLQGYDHALLAATESGAKRLTLAAEDQALLEELQREFWAFVEENYEGVARQDVIDIMASLLFSLIPLHVPQVRPMFLSMCKNVLFVGRAWGVDY